MTRYWDTIQKEKRIIRLAANGHTNASIAQLMGTTEGTIRNRRQRIRRLLEGLLPPEGPPVEYCCTGGNQQSPGHPVDLPGPTPAGACPSL